MVSELQFIAVGVFLTWCLVSSLSGMLRHDTVDRPARLLWREHDSSGWTRWREVHYGLTTADRRTLARPGHSVDESGYAALIETVMHQAVAPEARAIQYAVIDTSEDTATPGVLFVSDVHDMGIVPA